MYFDKNFPVIEYDSVGNGEFKDVKNLLRRVALNTKVKSNAYIYDTYDVKEGETPESIADSLYDDAELHWVIMLVNDITDRYHQWPMRYSQFLQYVNDKYDDVNAVHHYEISASSGDTTKKIEVYNTLFDQSINNSYVFFASISAISLGVIVGLSKDNKVQYFVYNTSHCLPTILVILL